ncbi:MAG TPA: beta-L-arabinofuranosidase domain-containing protein [Verrucomicrobiae bacterium]
MKNFISTIFCAAAILAPAVSHADIQPVVTLQAQPFPLTDVRLLDGPFRDAMLRDQAYLLSLDADRLLRNFRVNVGLPTDAKPYGGWEAPNVELRGHAVGHYLSACSMMYASTGNLKLKQQVDDIVAGMAVCQSNSPAAGFHEGYLSAFPESFFDRLEQGRQVWAPWYTLHKIMAGLLDAYQYTGNAQALEVLTNMANWVQWREDRLTPQQMQRTLENEQGGMTEVLANLYCVTGNTNYMHLSEMFNHQRVIGPLEEGQDRLNGLHANTQIPKIVGITREYEFTGEPQFLTAANTFWNAVALDRSYVIGGDSDNEHFFPTNQFDEHLSPDTCETCNTYNMLKLTHDLFEVEPDAAKMDFYERALYNDILASQDPDSDMFTYFMSLKPGHFKVYSTPENSFWCCVGTGMENHSKYGNTIYYQGADSLYVNLFIASELNWADKGITVRQETQFPESDTTTLKIKAQRPVTFAMKIRYPDWAVDGVKVSINGKKQKIESTPGSYYALDREWHNGDTVKIQMPMRLHTEFLPDTTNQVAVLYGPIVLAGELGTTNMPNPLARDQNQFNRTRDVATPVLVTTVDTLLKHIKPVSGKPLTFRTRGIGEPEDVTLEPFYQIHRQRYTVYWPIESQAEWKAHSANASPTR